MTSAFPNCAFFGFVSFCFIPQTSSALTRKHRKKEISKVRTFLSDSQPYVSSSIFRFLSVKFPI